MAKKKWVCGDDFFLDWDGDGFVEMDGGEMGLWLWDFWDRQKVVIESEERGRKESNGGERKRIGWWREKENKW